MQKLFVRIVYKDQDFSSSVVNPTLEGASDKCSVNARDYLSGMEKNQVGNKSHNIKITFETSKRKVHKDPKPSLQNLASSKIYGLIFEVLLYQILNICYLVAKELEFQSLSFSPAPHFKNITETDR